MRYSTYTVCARQGQSLFPLLYHVQHPLRHPCNCMWNSRPLADQSSSSIYPAWCKPWRDVLLFNTRLKTLPWAPKGARYMSRKRCCDLDTQQNTANHYVYQLPFPFAFYPECHRISGWPIFQTLKQNDTGLGVLCISFYHSSHLNLSITTCALRIGWWSSLALQPLSDAQIYTWHGHTSPTTGTLEALYPGACIFSTTCQSKRWRRVACLGCWWELNRYSESKQLNPEQVARKVCEKICRKITYCIWCQCILCIYVFVYHILSSPIQLLPTPSSRQIPITEGNCNYSPRYRRVIPSLIKIKHLHQQGILSSKAVST